MPELAEVETPRNAGFVDSSYKKSANAKRIEQDEEELRKLMEQAEAAPEAKPQASSEAEQDDLPAADAEEKSYKKRYGDLRTHSNKQADTIKQLEGRIKELEDLAKKAPKTGDLAPPASDEELAAWAKKYPQVAAFIETIADRKAQQKFESADARLRQVDKMTEEAKRKKAEDEIRSFHPDFDELRSSDGFHKWADDQPKWVQDALYENQDDPRSVVRVIDLFKVDNGMDAKGATKRTKEAASAVSARNTAKPDAQYNRAQFTESQVQRMSAQEYEKNSDAIMEAIRSGKFLYDLSGAAR